METGEQDLHGMLVFITAVRPITDSPDMLCSIGGRLRAQDAVTFSTETAIDTDQGQCPQLVETRYAKVRARVPAGSVWTFAQSVQPESQLAGER